MQGYLESPCLWDKHTNFILREIGLTPTVHEPYLYYVIINGQCVRCMQQFDNFAIAAPDSRTADLLLDIIDDRLTMQVKRQGYLDMYNGIDVIKTGHYIKVLVRSFTEKVSKKHLTTWMKLGYPYATGSTPLSSDHNFQKKFNSSVGDPESWFN